MKQIKQIKQIVSKKFINQLIKTDNAFTKLDIELQKLNQFTK